MQDHNERDYKTTIRKGNTKWQKKVRTKGKNCWNTLQHKELQDDSNIINYTCKNLYNKEKHEESLQDHNEKDFARYHSPITIFFLLTLFSLASHLVFSPFLFSIFFSRLNQLHFILERKRNICENIMYLVHLFILLQKKRFVCT